MSRDGVWDVHELLALLKPKFDARKLLETDADVAQRFEDLLAAVEKLRGRIRNEVGQLTHFAPHVLWQCGEEMPPALKVLLGLDGDAPITFCGFVFGSKAATLAA
jgi:hypothetical protein